MYTRLLLCTIIFLLSSCNRNEDDTQTNTPFKVAINAMGKDFQIETSNLNISQTLSSVESPNTATVTIEQSDLLYDSVNAIKDIFVLSFDNSKWVIQGRRTLYRCHHDRGSHQFSSALCK
ncbi:hypothetical protein RPR_p16 (plasmid) [Rickettsia peacockii str. Rustic]|uniref:Auto-transporter adhesin head GIN domain-containing protein n=1 Tax=Rickettsia peacockii (strain Rustic) TaxID=562019 RepID=C4K307_RICPU|nr:hypothetical protein [Rickettsia peacockii]ACR47960.1 hypothetical protein RPR_p16 [Rickettsia peacockii str. Rustic]